MGSKTMWLAVEVGEGMFPSERYVRLRTYRGDVSLFVHEDEVVAAKNGSARVSVELLDSDERYGLVEIRAQHGLEFVKVERKDLSDPGTWEPRTTTSMSSASSGTAGTSRT